VVQAEPDDRAIPSRAISSDSASTAVEPQLFDAFEKSILQAIAQRRGVLGVALALRRDELAGSAEASDSGDVQGPRAHAALVAAAVQNRAQPRPRAPAADVESADAFRTVDFVGAHRQQVDVHRVDVDRQHADALRGVGVEEDLALPSQRADLGDRLHRADLVVDVHDRDQHRVVADRVRHLLRIETAGGVDRQVGHFGEPGALQGFAAIEHCLVLGSGGNDVPAAAGVEAEHSLNREIVRLGGAAGPDDVGRPRTDQLADLTARRLDRFVGLPAPRMGLAGSVAETLAEVRQHRLEDSRVDGRRRMVIEVYAQVRALLLFQEVFSADDDRCATTPGLGPGEDLAADDARGWGIGLSSRAAGCAWTSRLRATRRNS